ncbi:MAG: hypothetical protein J6K78_00610 [Tidjanibacter sp.]|nr:hypothetical protein [Tidjanibacter sp.]
MKRFFTFLTTILFAVATIAPASAQQRGEWSIKGGVGWYSLPDIIGALVAGLSTAFGNPEGTERQDFILLLNPNVEAHYGINDWLALGGSLTVGYSSAKSVFTDTGAMNKSASALYPSLMFSAKTQYFRSGAFAMYGSWGVGAMALAAKQWSADGNTSNNNFAVAPMGNIYPLCFSYGGRTGGFAELGWGAKGVVNVGVYCAF